MKLGDIIENCGEYSATEIVKIAFDTADVIPGTLFFCLKGRAADGHDFIRLAEERGAAAAVTEKDAEAGIPLIKVGDTRSALSLACKRFYGRAADRLKIFAVTGTNGKTTTTNMLKSIFEADGKKTGLIGTNSVEYGGIVRPATLTTPDPTLLHRLFADMEKTGVTHVIMEASAHALALKKLDGIRFSVVGFTNLTRDHLDFFGDMEAYKRAKISLFGSCFSPVACVNADDACGREIMECADLEICSYGVENKCRFRAENIVLTGNGSGFMLGGGKVKLKVPGKFNVYNALCAFSMASAAGTPTENIIDGLNSFRGVEGRFESVSFNGGSVIIDFAHTDDGLKKILTAVREFTSGRVITVFGCGGDRDRSKRPLMGEVAARLSDIVIVTSDNPRGEKPENIISDIENGIKTVGNVDYFLEPDRKKAIRRALELMKNGDTTVIAGKGAEKYQEISGVKYPFNDREYVLGLIGEKP